VFETKKLISHFNYIFSIDRRVAIGITLSVGLVSGYTVSAVSKGYSQVNTRSQLLSNQSSVVADSIKKDAEDCVTGEKEGTIGYSIKQALNIHTQFASATPNIESLFDINNDCFSGINQVIDLSFTIPSLSSIMSSAQDAMMRYAEKKICTAVNNITGLVTTPINQSIDKVNQLNSFGDLNGLTNDLVKQGMTRIDPNLGAEYHNKENGGTYNINVNPFNAIQTDFSGKASQENIISTSGSSSKENNNSDRKEDDNNGIIQSIGNLFD